MQKIEHYVHHVVAVLDRSGSMSQHSKALVQAMDQWVAELAADSAKTGHETRLTVYDFDDRVRCLVWDMDVRAFPSIAGLYEIGGQTALIDATMVALKDMQQIPRKYGSHGFLLFLFSDGYENASRTHTAAQLDQEIRSLDDYWTIAALMPDAMGAAQAVRFGFPPNNVTTWNTRSSEGAKEAATVMAGATRSYTAMRASGKAQGTKYLFAPDPSKINDEAVAKLGMTPVKPTMYDWIHVGNVAEKTRMIDYFAAQGLPWKLGRNFYQLQKDELIAADKELALVKTSNSSQVVYIGPEIRTLLGLPDDKKVRVAPGLVPGWQVYVQSKSADRHVQSGGLLIRK